MAVVLLILSVVATAALSVYQNNDNLTKTTITNQRLNGIEKALQDFRYTHHRLPCPADARLSTSDAAYAMEGQNIGKCDDGSPQATFKVEGTAGGAIPTQSLNLSHEMMYDGWGRRFTYVVDARMTAPAIFLQYKLGSTCPGNIKVTNNGTVIANKALYAIISHGSNGHGAFLASGNRRDAGSSNTGELDNAGLDSSFADVFDANVVTQRRTENSSDYSDSYDDIVRYKERWSMITQSDVMISSGTFGENEFLKEIAVSEEHTCSLTNFGNAFCWGYNSRGQLGDGTLVNRDVPTKVIMPEGVAFTQLIVNDARSCAQGSDDKAYCWGENSFGQLGDGTQIDRSEPTPVIMPTGVLFTQYTTEDDHTCALADSGDVYCWGDNTYGRLGDGTTTARLIPTKVTMPVGVSFTAVNADDNHVCAHGDDDELYCWGRNTNYTLGDGTNTNRNTPTKVSSPAGIVLGQLTLSSKRTCAIGSDNEVYCWGVNVSGELGDGTLTTRSIPTKAINPGGVAFAKVYVDAAHSCAISTLGKVYCWGENGLGQVGDGTTALRNSPTLSLTPAGEVFSDMALTRYYICAYGPNGAASCWGRNLEGQLGNDTLTNSTTPVDTKIPPGVNFIDISADDNHVCTVGDDINIYCWGNNTGGQVGDDTFVDAHVPTKASFDKGMVLACEL
ncbi:MAG: hypothetical protein MK052_05055 [Alphaproteobacteria bacterium]|nr:hypothetical protein [Alphaproteobacteria bacterium]